MRFGIRWVLLSALATSWLATAADARGRGDAALATARQALRDKRHDEAIQAFRSAVEADPALLPQAWGWGMALYAKGRLEAAAELFERILQAHPDAGPARFGRGLVRMRSGGDAEADFRAALALDGDDVRARFRLGQVLYDRGAFAESVGQLRGVLRRRFVHQPARHALILALRDSGKEGEALQEAQVFRRVEVVRPHILKAERIVRARPGDKAARELLASLYRRAGKPAP